MSLRGRSLLDLRDLSPDEIARLLDLAERFRDEGIPRAHPGKLFCALFFNPSLRTRTSVEAACAGLGVHPIVHDVGKGVWKLETRDGVRMDGEAAEHVRDAVGHFLSRAVHGLGVRCFADPARPWEENRRDAVLRAIAAAADVPLVNLESATAHPMQGLADLLVLRNRLAGPPAERTVAVTWAWHPRPLPTAVADTAVVAFARAGYRVRLVHPPGFELDDEVTAAAREAAGDRFTTHLELDEGLTGVDAIYAKSWGARGEYGPDAPGAGREGLEDWIVDARRQALGGTPAGFLHCLPVRRNVVVADEVLDGPMSWVGEQAEARVWTQAAVLHELL